EINSLIVVKVFKFVTFNLKAYISRIFKSRLVNEVKRKGTPKPYEKSRFII
ncbi:hypothetical protein DL98DRAFT_442853, partial [Cadophora sp. DSE1049]